MIKFIDRGMKNEFRILLRSIEKMRVFTDITIALKRTRKSWGMGSGLC